MQRVVSINLNGNAYQLEDNGYNALFAYLDATDAQLKDNPNRERMLTELEARIAELCKACLSPHKNVVTSMEVDRILAELGPIPAQSATEANRATATGGQATSNAAGTGAAATQSGSGSSSSGPSTGPFVYRRLYQIREGSMIGGVCMGLAEYMHIDVTFIRIMFVVFALVTSGWGVLAYAVLMFVVPRVETRADASTHDAVGTMPPHRWPWEAGWPWDKHGWPWGPQRSPQTPSPAGDAPQQGAPDWRQEARDMRQQARDTRQQAREARREWRAERHAARMAYHPVSSWWGTFAMILCFVFAFFWLSIWTRGHFFFGWPFFWGFPHWIGIIVFFMVMRLIFMPVRMSRWYGYGYGPYVHPHYAWISMWNGLAWFALMIFGIWAAYHYIPEVHDFFRNFQTSWRGGGFRV